MHVKLPSCHYQAAVLSCEDRTPVATRDQPRPARDVLGSPSLDLPKVISLKTLGGQANTQRGAMDRV